MKMKWFERKGIFFIPVSVIGWLIAGVSIGYCVHLFIDIDSRSHSVSDTLMNFVFNALIVAIVYSVLGFFTSKETSKE
jgi:F0F1-type ATP synthase membrane subunit c/vacuolar-type H+-ATPase subunit K